MKPTLFVDRDGTIMVEPDDLQLDELDKVAFVPGALEALIAFARAGWRLVLVTNQPGLGTERFPIARFEPAQRLMCKILESCGVIFDEVLICPHREVDLCDCRKPWTGLMQRRLAAVIDWERSVLVGDRECDRSFAVALGIKGFVLDGRVDWDAVRAEVLGAARRGFVTRRTKETRVSVSVGLDETRPVNVRTGLPFFDHLLTQVAVHGGLSLLIEAAGDLEVDDHHLVEDVALSLGAALDQALGDRRGISRYGFLLPMDEALAQCALDLSGRPFCSFQARLIRESVGGLATEMIPHFFRSFADGLRATLHLRIDGENHHHMAEAGFKALGRTLRQAVARTSDPSVPSSKEAL